MPNRHHAAGPVLGAGLADAVLGAILQGRDRPRELGPDNLAEFCHLMNGSYQESRVTQLICSELEAVERGDTQKLILTIPPREGKTFHTSWYFPAWWIGRHPQDQLILASYNDDLAEDNSSHVQDILRADEWPFPECRMQTGNKRKDRWRTTTGNIIKASGIGGALTGFGGHLLLIDDYVKNKEEAESETLRDRAWGWFTTVASTRQMKGARWVVCATRWHEDDLIGRILKSDDAANWKVVSLPMVAVEEDPGNDPLGRKKGEWLNGMIPRAQVEATWRVMEPREKAALYQQSPQSGSGNLFLREHWVDYDRDKFLSDGLRPLIITVDSAFGQTVNSDLSAACVWGKLGNYVYLMDVWGERVDFPTLIARLRDLHTAYGVPLLIENKASGQSAIQTFRKTDIPVIPFKVERGANHESRADQVTWWVQSGHVLIPSEKTWPSGTVSREEFLDQHAKFPHGVHDDLVDNTSMALKQLLVRSPLITPYIGGPRVRSYNIRSRSGIIDLGAQRAVKDLFGA